MQLVSDGNHQQTTNANGMEPAHVMERLIYNSIKPDDSMHSSDHSYGYRININGNDDDEDNCTATTGSELTGTHQYN